MQVLRQDGVFHWAKQRRMTAHQEQAEEQDVRTVQPEADAGDQHDDDFKNFDQPRQLALSYLSASCPVEAENRKNGG